MTAPTHDALELSRLIASHPDAQTSLAGPKPAASRSLWSLLSFKVKALALGLLAAGAVSVAPPGSLSLFPDFSSAKASLSDAVGVVGPLSKADPSAAMAPADASARAAFAGRVGALSPAAPALAAEPAAAPAKAALASPPAPAKLAAPAAVKAPTPATDAIAAGGHPLARDVLAEQNRALSSKVAKALPNGGSGMSSSEIALKLLKVDPFLGLATAIENVEHKVYYDPGGTNIAMGYCVTKRVAEYGRDRVVEDLMGAGLSKGDAQKLLSSKRRDHKGITLTPEGALRLLEITKPDYEMLAENAYGKDAYAKLPEHRKAVLTYIAYNTGNVAQFKTLIASAQKGDHVKAMSNMAMRWRDHDGSWQTNNRSRAWLQAAWLGKDHLADALSNPMAFESDVAAPHKESVIASLAKPGAIRDKLLAKRSQASAWAFKALGRERDKANDGPKAP